MAVLAAGKETLRAFLSLFAVMTGLPRITSGMPFRVLADAPAGGAEVVAAGPPSYNGKV